MIIAVRGDAREQQTRAEACARLHGWGRLVSIARPPEGFVFTFESGDQVRTTVYEEDGAQQASSRSSSGLAHQRRYRR